MKTAVQITFFRRINYGAALQAYALSTAIRSLGWNCITLDYVTPEHPPFRSRLNLWLENLLCARRNLLYNRFLREELQLSPRYPTKASLMRNPPQADVYITGSDQTFNPAHNRGDSSYLLDFVPQARRSSVRKISYASSFTRAGLPPEFVEEYRRLLSDYDALSVREESGVALLRKLGFANAVRCCDPTLLLTTEEWRAFAEKAIRKLRKPYILAYVFPGVRDHHPKVRALIADLERQLGCETIFLSGRKKDFFKSRPRVFLNASPYEFLDLFFHAKFVVTSSFHGTVFSLHAGVPFLTLANRDATHDSRAITLLQSTGAVKHLLTYPLQDNPGDIAWENYIQDDYSTALRQQRENSMEWLRRQLEQA